MITVMITDDDAITRAAYRELISAQPDMRVVAEASGGVDAYQKAIVHKPDVLLMDLHMPSMDGVAATRKIVDQLPDIRILVVTVFDQPEDVEAAVTAGAAGFIVKNGPMPDFLRSIRLIHAGKGILSPEVTGGVLEMVRGASQEPVVNDVEIGLGSPVQITKRESDILQQIAMGKSNPEIAKELYLAPTSVKTYVSRLRAKLNARTRAELVTLYYVSSRISSNHDMSSRSTPVFGDKRAATTRAEDRKRHRWRT